MTEKEYIERRALIEDVRLAYCTACNSYNGVRCRSCRIEDSMEMVENAPAADVVEVVRCEDCAVPHNKWTGCPNLIGLVPPPDFFCARGERKEKTRTKQN